MMAQDTVQKQLLAALLQDVDAREVEVDALRTAAVTRTDALRMAASRRDGALRFLALQARQLQDLRASLSAGRPATQVQPCPSTLFWVARNH